jgi:stringent starvation protein B
MSEPGSTKPYFLRAMYEWCVDNGLTPHLAVIVDAHTRVPPGYVKDGEIVLNINYSATKGLLIGNDAVTFAARFGGVSFDIYVPIAAVRGIFARENGQGMFFELPQDGDVVSADHSGGADEPPPTPSPGTKRPALKLVK